jgi:hypothetical protein
MSGTACGSPERISPVTEKELNAVVADRGIKIPAIEIVP